jgi:hypothetical protein
VLEHCNLKYYKSQKADEPLGVIQLHTVDSLVRKAEGHEIKMVVAGRKSWLRLETEAEVDAWMAALERSWSAAAAANNARAGGREKMASRTSLQYDGSTEAALARAVDASFADKLRGCEVRARPCRDHGGARWRAVACCTAVRCTACARGYSVDTAPHCCARGGDAR